MHVPFCATVCAYCDFAVVAGQGHRVPEYLDAVVAEIEAGARADAGRGLVVPLETAYLGGGTPSLLPVDAVARLLDALRVARGGLGARAEITIEANPGTFTTGDVLAWRAAGVNRVSLGVQSLDDPTLRRLGRTHDAAAVGDAFRRVRDGGIRSLSLDLIYGLPWQDRASWTDGLARALALGPDHVSLYALSVEPGTRLARQVAAGRWHVADDDLVADMYEAALPLLADAGLAHHEVSNWARPGHESRHNLAYWRNEAYVGVGPGAHRYLDGRRSWNVRALRDYLRRHGQGAPLEGGHETLDAHARIGETAILALRVRDEGIDFQRFAARFGVDPRDRWGACFAEAANLGLMVVDRERARLTDAGLLVSNEIGARMLATMELLSNEPTHG